MSRKYTETNYTTAVAVDTTLSLTDDFDVARIDIAVDIAAVSAGSLTITKTVAALGSTYDTLVRSINMIGVTSYVIGNDDLLKGFKSGDALAIEYSNADTRTITLTATLVQ